MGFKFKSISNPDNLGQKNLGFKRAKLRRTGMGKLCKTEHARPVYYHCSYLPSPNTIVYLFVGLMGKILVLISNFLLMILKHFHIHFHYLLWIGCSQCSFFNKIHALYCRRFSYILQVQLLAICAANLFAYLAIS